MANRVKIVGYAKKEFFTDGIEYRDFSPDLVGNQITNEGGTPLFTISNFAITTNLDGKDDKIFITNDYGDFYSLCDLGESQTLLDLLAKYENEAKLNLDKTNVLNYAFFGSLKEYVRVSLENIIINWPASLYVTDNTEISPLLSGDTVLNYSYNTLENEATFTVSGDNITNIFGINYVTDGSIVDTFSETNDLRNLIVNYSSYVVSNNSGDYPITAFSGASATTNSTITLTVKGNPFTAFTETYHIKPNELKREEFFMSLNDFENNLLNRQIIPIYTSEFKTYAESETGAIIETFKKSSWPVRDGYNIDFNSIDYANYVSELLTLAELNDQTKSNLMTRFLVSNSISEFDTLPDVNCDYEGNAGQKMTSTLKIYGREFDELKRFSDGISFANVVTYDKKNNTPDVYVKNLSRILGWELTNSLTDNNLIQEFLQPGNTSFEGFNNGLTKAEAEVELWRRIILNTPWIWKSKGTRKAIEFLFKFIGAPDGLVTFNEYLYVADQSVDVGIVTTMMEHFNDTTDISGLNMDDDGYPQTLANTPDMYFQKAGLWYRTTGGPNPDIDLLEGNNPHIGPYDGGQAYIDQFTNCLVPNFEGVDEYSNVELLGDANLFTNYNNGTFNECCEGNVVFSLDYTTDLTATLTENQGNIINNNPVTLTGCSGTTIWTVEAYLGGVKFYDTSFFSTTVSAATAPTSSVVLSGLTGLTTSTELSGTTWEVNGNTFIIVDDNTNCVSTLTNEYLRVEICVNSNYNCTDETVTGLTAFNISTLSDDACTASNALSRDLTVYHDGAAELPVSGDTIYSDTNGVNTVNYSAGTEHYIGGDYTDENNWLQTDANGVMQVIICPIVECLVEVGQDHSLAGSNSIDIFYIEGVAIPSNATIVYELFDVVRTSPSMICQVAMTINGSTVASLNADTVTQVTTNPLIVPDTGQYGLYDYSVQSVNTSTADAWKVRMSVTYLENGCITGTTFQVHTFTN
tara:strand:+ start:2941 stop:5862 length:2922 start_codon:yes stop_codon:yes gene_type:complete